ncbi:MAG: hypothetical protein CFH38_01522, partial [Alphaproteobacteria bacterium MarineAlpha10_Bin1]
MTTPRIVYPTGSDAGKALGAAEFARLMAPAGPFEATPHLAL